MPKIVDKEKIKILKGKGLSQREIAKIVDCNPNTVNTVLKLSDSESKSLESFNRDLPAHLTKVISKLVARFHEIDLDKVSPYQLAGMLSLLIDKQRLLSGQSTSNQQVLFHIVEQACKASRHDGNEGGDSSLERETGGS